MLLRCAAASLTLLLWAGSAGAQEPIWLPPTRPPEPPPLAPLDDDAEDDGVDARLYAGLGMASLGAATLVVFGIAQSRLRQLEDDPRFAGYRAAVAADDDACRSADRGDELGGGGSAAEVRGICDEAANWEAVSYLTLPTGLGLLGVATYLIVTSDTVSSSEGDAVAWRLSPQLGWGGGGLLVEGRF